MLTLFRSNMSVKTVVAALTLDLNRDTHAREDEDNFMKRRPKTIAMLLHKTMVPNGIQLYSSATNPEMLELMKTCVP